MKKRAREVRSTFQTRLSDEHTPSEPRSRPIGGAPSSKRFAIQKRAD
jgi:hypothetical protein